MSTGSACQERMELCLASQGDFCLTSLLLLSPVGSMSLLLEQHMFTLLYAFFSCISLAKILGAQAWLESEDCNFHMYLHGFFFRCFLLPLLANISAPSPAGRSAASKLSAGLSLWLTHPVALMHIFSCGFSSCTCQPEQKQWFCRRTVASTEYPFDGVPVMSPELGITGSGVNSDGIMIQTVNEICITCWAWFYRAAETKYLP